MSLLLSLSRHLFLCPNSEHPKADLLLLGGEAAVLRSPVIWRRLPSQWTFGKTLDVNAYFTVSIISTRRLVRCCLMELLLFLLSQREDWYVVAWWNFSCFYYLNAKIGTLLLDGTSVSGEFSCTMAERSDSCSQQ